MNFKKLKLWKLLAVGGVVGLVATVPIITTACSSTTESNIIDETPQWSSDSGFVNENGIVSRDLKKENSTKSGEILQVSAKGLAIDAGWANQGATLGETDFEANKQSLESNQINSDDISNSIGIKNVIFKSLKLESLSENKTFDISNANYNGKFKLVLNAIPKDGYTWKDNTNEEKSIEIELIINVDSIKCDTTKLDGINVNSQFDNSTMPSEGQTFKQMLQDKTKLDLLVQEINTKITNESNKTNFKGVKVILGNEQDLSESNTNKLKIKFVAKPGFYTSNSNLNDILNKDTNLALKNTNPIVVTDRFVYNDNISINNPLEIVDSFQNLINPDKVASKPITTKLLNENISALINKNDNSSNVYKKKLIVNYDSIKEKIDKISITSTEQNEQIWGNDPNWAGENFKPSAVVYYHFEREPISIKSVGDLKKQLTSQLGEIMDQSLNETAKNTYSDFRFEENSALLIEKSSENTYDDYLKMHVKAKLKDGSSQEEKDLELRLPVSDINYVPEDVKITITAQQEMRNTIPNLENIPSFVKFNVGINSTHDLSKDTNSEITNESNGYSTTIKGDNIGALNADGLGTVSAESLAKQLGWYKNTNYKNDIRANVTSINDSMINDYKVASSLHMFNVDFTEISINGDNNSSSPNYTGKFSLKLKGTPKKGYYWNDKTSTGEKDNSTKEIDINNFTIKLADAEVNRDIPFTASGEGSSKAWSYQTNLTDLPTTQNELNTWINVESNKKKLEDEINKKLNKSKKSNSTEKKNIAVKYEILPFTSRVSKFKQYHLKTSSKTNLQLKCKVVLLPGHELKDPKQENRIGEFQFTISKKG